MLSKQERQKLQDIEARFYDEEPEFVTLFDQLGQRRPTTRTTTTWLRPLLVVLALVCVLGAASTSFVLGPLVGTVVTGSVVGLLGLGALVYFVRRR